MSKPRGRSGPASLLLALLLPLACALPTLTMGYTREDWLFLWTALDPGTAPEGSTGIFPRPVALAFWRLSVELGGDASLAMHLPMLVLSLWLAGMVFQMARRHVAVGGRDTGWWAAAAAAIVGSHAALVEPRQWAAASNGLLAAALATTGIVLLATRREVGTAPTAAARSGSGRGPVRSVAGWGLLVAAGLARVDAWALMLAPLAGSGADGASGRRSWAWRWLVLASLGASAWVMMQRGEGGWGFWPDHAGRLLRRLFLPWGPPLPGPAASGLGWVGLALLAAAAFVARGARRGFVLITLVILAAAATVPLSPAGRYLIVPVIALGLAVAQGMAAAGSSRARRVIVAVGLGIWLVLNAASCWLGNTSLDLRRRSAAETRLYRAVQANASAVTRSVVLLDAPPLGWRGDARDAENVASAALRRSVEVKLGGPATEEDRDRPHEPAPGSRRDDHRLVLRFDQGSWRLVPASP